MELKEKIRTATSKGCVSKAWYTDKGIDYLIKGNLKFDGNNGYGYEPYSEVMAYAVAKHLEIPCLEYEIAVNNFKDVNTYGINHVSVCKKDIIPRDCQRIPIIGFVEAICNKKDADAYMCWMTIKRLGIDTYNFCRMLLFDAIIGNEDRHLNNWDILVTKNGVQMAKLFDNGGSLLALVPDEKLSLKFKIGRDVSKPFKETHTKQIAFIKRSYPDFKLNMNKNQMYSVLNNIMTDIQPTLSLLPDKRRMCVEKYLRNRFIHYVSMFIKEE